MTRCLHSGPVVSELYHPCRWHWLAEMMVCSIVSKETVWESGVTNWKLLGQVGIHLQAGLLVPQCLQSHQ